MDMYNEDINFGKRNALNAELAQLMGNLAANTSSIGDWKIIKIYEARMKGEEDPYDFDELTSLREATRVRINEIQEELKNLSYEEESEEVEEEDVDEEFENLPYENQEEEDVDEEVETEIEEENEVETDEEPSDDVEE